MVEEDSEHQQAAMKFPRDKHQYILGAALATEEAATLYRAKYVDPLMGSEVLVGVKIVSTYGIEDIYTLTKEVHEAETCDHESLVKVHCSFKIKDRLWIIMPPLSRLSMRSVIRSAFPNGLPESAVSFILKETLEALNYMHGKNKLHQSIGADCIFLDEKSRVKLVFRSLSSDEDCHYHLDASSSLIPDWTMAPELITDYRKESSKATDVWMFGLMALELFCGRIPASDLEEFKLFVVGIDNELRMFKKKKILDQGKVASGFLGKFGVCSCFIGKQRKKIPGALAEVIAACLSRDPQKRPTTSQLMGCNFFQKPFAGQESLAKLRKKAFK